MNEKCKELKVDTIIFMCPELISATKLRANTESVDESCEYMARVMKVASEGKKKDPSSIPSRRSLDASCDLSHQKYGLCIRFNS